MRLRTRTRGQAIVMAAAAMVALVGAGAMVVDMGVFFVIQRQMQNAADTAALAAVWYEPVCDATQAPKVAAGCQPVSAWTHPIPPSCAAGPDPVPCAAATEFAQRNLDLVSGLCSGPYGNARLPAITPYPLGPIPSLDINVYSVTIDCDAPYWFGHIFPNLLSHRISTSAAATLGWRGPNGDIAASGTTLIARLFRTP
jgi:hypothetical protein